MHGKVLGELRYVDNVIFRPERFYCYGIFFHIGNNFAERPVNFYAPVALFRKRRHRKLRGNAAFEKHIDDLMIHNVVIASENAPSVRILFVG